MPLALKFQALTILSLINLTSYLVNPQKLNNNDASFWNCPLPQGHYICDEVVIDDITQSASYCQHGIKSLPCRPIKNSDWTRICDKAVGKSTGKEIAFYETINCRWTNGYSFAVSLSLSVFFGFLGLDRFYLGYPTLGVLKLFTCGLGGLWWLVDIILIVFQVVGPFDGSSYVMNYFGPIMEQSGYEL